MSASVGRSIPPTGGGRGGSSSSTAGAGSSSSGASSQAVGAQQPPVTGGTTQVGLLQPAPALAPSSQQLELAAALGSMFRGAAAATDAEALRCVARLLLQAPPPHKQHFSRLGQEVPKRMGRACPQLRQQCVQWPDVFCVELEGRSTYTVRLVHPRLLSLAAALPPPNSSSIAQPYLQQQPAQAIGAAAADTGSPRSPRQSSSSSSGSSSGSSCNGISAGVPGSGGMPAAPVAATLATAAGIAAGGSSAATASQNLEGAASDSDGQARVVASLPASSDQLSASVSDTRAAGAAWSAAVACASPAGPEASSPAAAGSPQQPQAGTTALSAAGLEQPQTLPTMALYLAGPPVEAAAAATAVAVVNDPKQQQQHHLPDAGVCVVADPYGEQLIAMLQHCGCCSRIGLAVQAHGGRPALVSLYAPPALMRLRTSAESAAETLVQWPAAVYLVDPLEAAAAYGGGADGDVAAAALLCSLQPLLEAPSVAKVVHGGGGALASLEAAIAENGAAEALCINPVCNLRLVLASMEFMLGLPHAPPPPASSLQPQADAGVGSYLPGSGYAGGGVAMLRGLHTHVARLRDALAGTGLWADRPQLLAALTARHFAALREDAQAALGAAGADDDAAARLLTRPLGPSQVELAARASRHLPELWAALVQEAVPWVAVHASSADLAGYRQQACVDAAGTAAI